MDPALKEALRDANYRHIFALAVLHADTTIRRYVWRGYRPNPGGEKQIMVGDKTAKDFVSEALLRLMDGRRTYDPARSLLENLNSITDSLIWTDKKSSDRSGVVDHEERPNEDGEPTDPISTAIDSALTPDEQLRANELKEEQKRCVEALKASFNGDKEMQNYLEAMSAGFKPSEISEVMEIPANRVYELRRKVTKYAPKFFGVPSFEELQRRLNEGR